MFTKCEQELNEKTKIQDTDFTSVEIPI